MTRWRKNAKEFDVSLNDDGSQSKICRIPKPILEILGNPNAIRFAIQGKKIIVAVGTKK